MVNDQAWYRDDFIPDCRQARRRDHRGTRPVFRRHRGQRGDRPHARLGAGTERRLGHDGRSSDGSYGIPEEIIYGYPVTCAGGRYEVVKGLEIDEFSRGKMDTTLKELLEERDGVKHLLG